MASPVLVQILDFCMVVLPCDVPATGADVSVFIDIIGMPLTPLSFSGAGQYVYRRLTCIDESPSA